MPADTRYREFNPDVEKHRELADAILDVLREKEDEYVPTGAIHEELVERGWASNQDGDGKWSPDWLRFLITYARPYLIDQNKVETTQRQRTGRPTHYWKVIEYNV